MSHNLQDGMITPQTFQCPTCWTASTIGTEPAVKCPSCGNTVIIPAQYRPQQPQFIFPMPVRPATQRPDINQMVKRSQRTGLIITVVILVFTFRIVGFWLLATNSVSCRSISINNKQ